MIEYICKYQNSFVSSYLFRHNLTKLMDKGINIYNLICKESQIFHCTFDFDDWPANHTVDSYEVRPYHDNYFHIRYKYKDCFPEAKFDSIDGKNVQNQAVYKIKYSINLIPIIGEHCQRTETSPGVYENVIM